MHSITEEAARRILGIDRPVPLSSPAMAAGLRVTFFPVASSTERVRAFADRLRDALLECGVRVIPYREALDEKKRSKVKEGIVVIAPGEVATGDLPVDHVQNLRKTTIVGIVDGPCPADAEEDDQAKLNSIVRTLAWSIVQAAIYVDDTHWTICTMNGAIIPRSLQTPLKSDVLSILIPKLAAPVVPPHASDFDMHEGALDLSETRYERYVHDFVESGPLWQETELLLFHTSMAALEFRNAFYKRIAAAYLDHRSGMSYGFLARQLATPVTPAREVAGSGTLPGNGGTFWIDGGVQHVLLDVHGRQFVARVPDVWMLTTRSGCDKSHLDPGRDILLMGLAGGRVIFETPRGGNALTDFKPSYDTLTILAHGIGNAVGASLLAALRPASAFPRILRDQGVALAHWHGRVDPSTLPEGYILHGETNPPVSCSTHQAALFALTGKMSAVQISLDRETDFLGDVHVEPHHGVNVTGFSLVDLARWALHQREPGRDPRNGRSSVPAPRSVATGH